MPKKRGISILDLIGLPPGSGMIIPTVISDQLENFAVLDYSAVTAGDVHIHRGTVQSIADSYLPALRNWPVQAPMLNTGLPFQLIRRRTLLVAPNNIEPAAQGWQIDLFLDRISVTIPGLKPAMRVEASGTTPRHLVPDPNRKDVRIVGGGTLRLVSNAGGAPAVMFVSPADPIDPDAPAGAVYELAFDPPHFFIGSSEFGLTVDKLLYDDSQVSTPADIAARGHGADWQGISIRESTVYMPRNAPIIGDLSVSVRDLLLGNPLGLQGEIQIEFGVSKVSPAAMVFTQTDVNGGEVNLQAQDLSGKGKVTYTKLENTDVGRVKCSGVDQTAQFLFTLPDGSTVRGTSTGYFEVRQGDKLGVQSIETDDQNQEALSLVYPFHFAESGDPHVPEITVSFPGKPVTLINPTDFDNVLYVGGRREHLQGIKFTASTIPNADVTKYQWQFGAGIGAETGEGKDFSPPISPTLGFIDLLLTDDQKRLRRLRVEVLTEGPLVIGTDAGVYSVDDQQNAVKLKARAVEGTYEAHTFNPSGLLMPAYATADVDAAGAVTTDAGTIAAVSVEMGHPDAGPYALPPGAPPPAPKRHLQVLMEFNTTDEYNWGLEGLAKPFSPAVLQEWAAQFGPLAEFVVIGRTCDIGSDDYNDELAQLRASRGSALLTSVVDLSRIYARSEFDAATGAALTAESAIAPALTAEEKSGQLIAAEHPELNGMGDRYVPPRQVYRRIDIYVVGGDEAGAAEAIINEQIVMGPSLRRTLVPGSDIVVLNVPPAPGLPTTYRVRLSVKWDSPTVASLSDAIPTMAEVLVAWDKKPTLPLPDTNQNANVTGPETFTLIGRWTHDSRTGATLFSLAFNNDGSPNGLFSADNAILATAMLLAPALLSGITNDSPSGAGARLAAMLGASIAASQLVNKGRVVVHGIEIQEQQRALGQFADATHRILLDYTAEISVNINNPAITIHTNNPLKVRYENCGLEYDGSKTGLAAVNLVYDEAKFDVQDPGEWVIGGKLGELLRVAGTRAGSGSTWFEIDLEFAIDLGVIKVTSATVRITFPTGQNDFGFELRGLGVEVNIPQTLEGKGRLAVGQGGSFKSDIQARIIPAGVEARASLMLDGDLKYLEVGVLLPVGIPLGSSGLGIFGFIGRFVVNGKRKLPAATDPVEREIAWYRALPTAKYEEAPGQFALGLGLIVGTLPDTAFSFNAVGMLTVAFPDPEVVISLDAKLASKPSTQASEQGSAGPQSLEMLGIIAVNKHEFILGIRGKYEIPKILQLKVPISAYFPINDASKAYYFRIGCDGNNGRTGDPVTAILLPGVVDFKCWLYLMMEEKELINLGNAPKYGADQIDLYGFSLGFGTGFDIDWSAGPISLHASAMFLLGLGTKPLTLVGMIGAEGELDLVIISASVEAYVQGKIQNVDGGTNYELDGDFKAEVDLGLFSVSGKVHFHIEDGPNPKVPTPEHPFDPH